MIFTQVKNLLTRLHDNENGDIPVGPILVIGLVVIPLVIAIMMFGDELAVWLREKWEITKETGEKNNIEF